MKKTILLLFSAAVSSFAQSGNIQFNNSISAFKFPDIAYASLPTADSSNTGNVYRVTDAVSSACAAGGGSTKCHVVSNGSAWVVFGGSGSGATDFSGLTGTATDAQIPNNITIDLATAATALAANGANCSAGQAANGVDATGAAENCIDLASTYLTIAIAASSYQPLNSNLTSFAAKTAPTGVVVGTTDTQTLTNKSISGSQITSAVATATALASDPSACSSGQYVSDIAANGTLTCGTPSGGGSGPATAITSSTTLPGTCTAGDVYFDTDATSGLRLYVCDSANNWRYTITGSTTGTGVLTLAEGTAPGAGANAGDHNIYVDSSDSKLKSHENGGSVVVYSTESGTATLINKTIDAEATGNTITLPYSNWLEAAVCSGTTGNLAWDTLSTLAPTATCSAGTTATTMMRATADFPDADGDYSLQRIIKLPSGWTGAVDVNLTYQTAATSGNTVWQVATSCRADGEVNDAAFNTASASAADAAKGTTLQLNDVSISGITTTGCAAGEIMHLKVFRNRTHASDTITGVVSLVGVEVITRRAL